MIVSGRFLSDLTVSRRLSFKCEFSTVNQLELKVNVQAWNLEALVDNPR